VRLARPEVDHIRIVRLATVGPQRRGEVVDLGVSERRCVAVLVLRVRPVGRVEASASLWAGEVPASGQSMNAVPSCAAAAPATSAVAIRRRSRSRRKRSAAARPQGARAAATPASRTRPARDDR
jgi:hypothetical protein